MSMNMTAMMETLLKMNGFINSELHPPSPLKRRAKSIIDLCSDDEGEKQHAQMHEVFCKRHYCRWHDRF